MRAPRGRAGRLLNVTAGTAKLFKLLPDGRRQITGFVGAGHFLGLAVSDTYGETEIVARAEATEDRRGAQIGTARFVTGAASKAKLRSPRNIDT